LGNGLFSGRELRGEEVEVEGGMRSAPIGFCARLDGRGGVVGDTSTAGDEIEGGRLDENFVSDERGGICGGASGREGSGGGRWVIALFFLKVRWSNILVLREGGGVGGTSITEDFRCSFLICLRTKGSIPSPFLNFWYGVNFCPSLFSLSCSPSSSSSSFV